MKFATKSDMDKRINDILIKNNAIDSWFDFGDRLKYFRMREAENSNCQKGILAVYNCTVDLSTFDEIPFCDVFFQFLINSIYKVDFYYINHKNLEIRKLRVETLNKMLIAA